MSVTGMDTQQGLVRFRTHPGLRGFGLAVTATWLDSSTSLHKFPGLGRMETRFFHRCSELLTS